MNLQIEELEEKLNETIDNMVQEEQLVPKILKNICLSNSENYHLIDGRCIYFETHKLQYENAQQNCATKGGFIYAFWYSLSSKGQTISEANYAVLNSPKK